MFDMKPQFLQNPRTTLPRGKLIASFCVENIKQLLIGTLFAEQKGDIPGVLQLGQVFGVEVDMLFTLLSVKQYDLLDFNLKRISQLKY